MPKNKRFNKCFGKTPLPWRDKMEIFYWFFSSIIFYTWIGYPALLLLLSRLIPKKFSQDAVYPPVTIILTVHNEEQVIANRINNLQETSYPKHLLEILVASDGSTDRTDEIVETRCQNDATINLLKTEGGGKSATQNKAVPLAKGEIIVLTDAETKFNDDAVLKLIRYFADERVGCISGKLIIIKEDNYISGSQGFYWNYEMLLRKLESQIGTLHTASGSLMAFRKKLFRPIDCRYGDDCIIPLDILSQGFKVIHEDEAIAYERFPSKMEDELRTRTRMTLRNITCTLSKYELLNSFSYPLLSLSILSHKIFRWLTPIFMIAFFISNLFLMNQSNFYMLIFYSQLAFYSLGIVGFFCEKGKVPLPVASHIFSFLLANTGFLLGILKALAGRKVLVYKRGRAVNGE